MNKKTIVALTAIMMSSLALGALSFVKFNKNTFVKADATNKTVTLTSIEDLYVLAEGIDMLAEGDIVTGTETYIHTDITVTSMQYNEDNTKFLSLTNGTYGEYDPVTEEYTVETSEVFISLDVRGLVSYEVRGQATDPSGYNSFYSEFIPYAMVDETDEIVDDSGMVEMKLNTPYNVNTEMHTERIKFHFMSIGTLSISSIELTMSCATNN